MNSLNCSLNSRSLSRILADITSPLKPAKEVTSEEEDRYFPIVLVYIFEHEEG